MNRKYFQVKIKSEVAFKLKLKIYVGTFHSLVVDSVLKFWKFFLILFLKKDPKLFTTLDTII